MPTINELRAKYFIQPGEGNPPTEPAPAAFAGSRIKPLIDGGNYFAELMLELDTIGKGTPEENAKEFLLVTGWHTDLLGTFSSPPQPFFLDGPGGSTKLLDVLKDKARAGVDVYVLSFVNMGLLQNHATFKFAALSGFRDLFSSNIDAIVELRLEPALAKKCCLNVIGHSMGSAHAKLVVLGNEARAVGFTGGIDFVWNRYDDDTHSVWPFGWHDVAAKVEGPAVQRMYNFFLDMWNELMARQVYPYYRRVVKLDPGGPTWVFTAIPGTQLLDSRTLSAAAVGTHHVQVLHTFPAANNITLGVLPLTKPLAFAPEGLFTFRLALRKAILAAETYIYMEDWGFWSEEILGWVRSSLISRLALRVILVTGKDHPDEIQLTDYMSDALFNTLVAGLTASEIARIRVFMRDNTHVHSKTVIIDDHWANIGSACITRRSLYTDIENSVAFLDESDHLVKSYRIDLWAGHFEPAGTSVSDLNEAMDVWDRSPGGTGVTRGTHLNPLPLPVQAKLTARQKKEYDLFNDPDSRQPCGISLKNAWELWE